MKSFTHLHTHTEYSILDGAAKLDGLIEAALADGQPAISATDHGNMYGTLEFYKKCQKAGLKFIPGEEFYMAADSVDERPKKTRAKLDDGGGESEEGNKLYYHLTVLAETNKGFENLVKMSSKAFTDGYYYKPRVDWEMLDEFHEGLIITSGCLGGVVLQDLLKGNYEGARAKAGRLQDIFGRDNFFIELQDHGLPEQTRTNPDLMRIAAELNAPLLATNDSHYVHRDDAIAHDALLCVQTGARIEDTNRFKFDSEEHYLKSAAEMRYLFREVEDACDNTLWIAERSNVTLEYGDYHLPVFDVPGEFRNDDQYLRVLALEGAKERWGRNVPALVLDRLDYELTVVKDMGFSSYFLILWDLCRFARESDIMTGPGRGSAAGSAVSYALGVTQIDPIKYDLLFERFLNPSRISMPDIDLDMDSRYRDDMIRYAAEKYGEDHVAQIITFGQIKARASVRDATRVLGKEYGIGDKIVKAMPPLLMGRETPLHACLEAKPEYAETWDGAQGVRDLYRNDSDAQEIIDVALGLEGLRRQVGIHAAAVVIADAPLTEYLPVARHGEDKALVTQYGMENVEELGLLKMDFLGVRNLDTIDITMKLLEKRGIKFDINNIPLDDPATLAMLQKAQTLGIFQLEGSQMRELIRRLSPDSFHDIAALVALYRPGPMASNMHNDYADRKNGRQEVTYFHSDAEEILSETYGLMIYQEQMMRVAQKFGGYTLAEADNLRKACGKKIRELMAKEKEKLIEGIIGQGYDEFLANYIWEMIEPFADYSFNKSHAYGYGLIAYQTAYLKANYTIEYLSALLTTTVGDPKKTALYLNECRGRGIKVLPPNINKSATEFIPDYDTGSILFGFNGISGLGESAAEKILEFRSTGKFGNFIDFVTRTMGPVNKKVVTNLIYAGAFDQFGFSRQAMVEALPDIQAGEKKRLKDESKGITPLFVIDAEVKMDDMEEYDKAAKLAFEKSVLGVYISDHPLTDIMDVYDDPQISSVVDLEDIGGGYVNLVGLVSGVKKRKTKKGDLMAVFMLEDLNTSVEVVVFPKTMYSFSHFIHDDEILQVRGRLDTRDDNFKFIAQTIKRVELPA